MWTGRRGPPQYSMHVLKKIDRTYCTHTVPGRLARKSVVTYCRLARIEEIQEARTVPLPLGVKSAQTARF
jgi:hypothetical protein